MEIDIQTIPGALKGATRFNMIISLTSVVGGGVLQFTYLLVPLKHEGTTK